MLPKTVKVIKYKKVYSRIAFICFSPFSMRNFLLFILIYHFALLSGQTSRRPNVLLIMADDMGFSDLGCYGSEIKTPNLDKLAKEGTRLRQFYNGGICAPSRASLLTGQNPHKAGMGFFFLRI
jgi:hypothetical protein